MNRILLSGLLILALLTVSRFVSAGNAATAPTDFSVFPVSKPFTLSQARGKFVALHFLLKTECPYCLRYTHEYATKGKDQADVVHIFLKPDSEEAIAKWQLRLEGEDQPTIYRDPDAKLAKQFKIPGGYKFHGEVVHYPALVLLNPEGVEVFRYVGKNNADRLAFDQFVQKLDELRKK